jgi:hypothetical protein
VREQDRLYHWIKEWWESTHVSYAQNCTGTPIQRQQWGETALMTNNKAMHRVMGKGIDPTKLVDGARRGFKGRITRP